MAETSLEESIVESDTDANQIKLIKKRKVVLERSILEDSSRHRPMTSDVKD